MNWQGKRALCYRRVSTDDQSTYSLSDQQERLEKFCQLMSIQVVKFFEDDYSAKTFNRPGWSQMFEWIKSHKGAANLLLFTNWSRFSRAENIGETYMMIDRFFKLGITTQAIDQPLDLEIPENRLILAFYVASPMVENLRRASNTRHGMRRAMKSGNWCHKSPFGYRNARDEANKPILLIVPDKAKIIEDIFHDYLEGHDPQLLMKRAFTKGLQNKGHSTFTRIISNHLYAGLVRIESWKDEPEQIVKGIHSPIISEDIFWAAQNKLHGNNKRTRIYDDEVQMRGILRCNNCGYNLTGGRSRGKSGRYWYYYRCLRCNGQNFSVQKAHAELSEVLSAISLKPAYIQTLIQEVDRNLKEVINQNYHEAETLSKEIRGLEEKLQSLESKYIGNTLDFETYQRHYPVCRSELAEKRLRYDSMDVDRGELIQLYRTALPRMQNLDFLYQSVSLENKQQLLRLIFPEGLFKLKFQYRTPRLNSLFDVQSISVTGLVIGEKESTLHFMTEMPQIYFWCPKRESADTSKIPVINEVESLLKFILTLAA